MKNFRISHIAVIALASLIFANNVFALGVPSIPDVPEEVAVPEVVPEEVAVPEVVPEEVAVPEVVPEEVAVPEDIIPPVLDTETLGTWVSSFDATLVSNNVTNTIINQTQLPQIITAGANFTDELIDSQSSVLLDVSFPSLTDGLTITDAIGLPNYTISDVTSVISTIPTIVTSSNSTTGQFIVAPLGQIIPGQQIIILVESSVIPRYGGLKEIALQPAIDATPIGDTIEEWMTIEVDNKIPSSMPTAGLSEVPIIFLNVQYPYEQTGIGFNWGDPANFASPPTMTLVVNKTDSDSVQKDDKGCPLVDPYTLSSGVWTGNGLGEIFSRSIDSDRCEITIQTQHFSKFAFSLRHITSIHSSSPGTFSLGSVVAKSST
ncbi:MAG: hypothetical protein HZC29_02935, partial [Thaumarchaeota archaeon]|nr:hypothetical protein [Nitrososphaerota archaeon]